MPVLRPAVRGDKPKEMRGGRAAPCESIVDTTVVGELGPRWRPRSGDGSLFGDRE